MKEQLNEPLKIIGEPMNSVMRLEEPRQGIEISFFDPPNSNVHSHEIDDDGALTLAFRILEHLPADRDKDFHKFVDEAIQRKRERSVCKPGRG